MIKDSRQSNRAVEQQSSRKIQLQKLFLYLLLYWAAGLLLLSHCSLFTVHYSLPLLQRMRLQGFRRLTGI